MDRRNSRSLCLDVRSEAGGKVFTKLIATADMLVDGFKGGQLAKWGYSDDALLAINPRLVIVHISGYGQTGVPEYVSRPSFDGIGQAFSGFMEMNGFRDRPPIPAFPQVSDYYAGIMALAGGLAALYRAKATGEGESVDVAQYEVMLRCSGFYVMNYLNTGVLPLRDNNFNAGNGTYPCRDGVNLFVMIIGAGVVKRACGVLGIAYGEGAFPVGLTGVRKESPAAPILEEKLALFLQSHDSAAAEDILVKAGIPCSRVFTFAMGEQDPQYQAREIFTQWESADTHEPIRGINVVPRLMRNPGSIACGMPLVGQHNEEILKSLGYGEDEIATFYASNIMKKEATAKG